MAGRDKAESGDAPLHRGALTVLALRELKGDFDGQMAFALKGRKMGELSGGGTGVPVYWSSDRWRIYHRDTPVED